MAGGDDLRIGAAARYVGARPGDSANSFTLPSYVLADAFACIERDATDALAALAPKP